MAYPGEYRREQYYGEDGYGEGGNYGARGYQAEGFGGNILPLVEEEFERLRPERRHHRPEYVQEVEYVQPGISDLGMGLRDSNYAQERYGGAYGSAYGAPYGGGYEAGYGRNQPGYGVSAAYGSGGYEEAKVERLEEELAHERRRAHEAEAAAAAAGVYALHERHERKESEEELERFEPESERRHKHHFFGL